MAVDGLWGPETEDAIQQTLAASKPADTHEADDEPADTKDPTPPQPHSKHLVGGIVAGLAISGLAAAILITRHRRIAQQEPHDGI